jgi:hypothetical protein
MPLDFSDVLKEKKNEKPEEESQHLSRINCSTLFLDSYRNILLPSTRSLFSF